MTSNAIIDRAYGFIPICLTSEGARFLLIMHNKGHWGFPKGHKDKGETDLDAACREFVEETGIATYQLAGDPPEFSEAYSFTKNSGKRVNKTVKYYLATIPAIDGNPPAATVQPEEVSDYRWCSAAEAERTLTFDAARGVLKDCLTYLGQGSL